MANRTGNSNIVTIAAVAVIAVVAVTAVVFVTQENDEPTVGEVIENTVDEATKN